MLIVRIYQLNMNEQGDAGTSNASNTEDIANFRRKMELLKPMERKTAEGFLECKIHDQYCWPLENEPKEAEKIRKSMNQKRLRSAKDKERRSKETTEQRFTRLKTKKDKISEETEESRNRRLEVKRENNDRRKSEET